MKQNPVLSLRLLWSLGLFQMSGAAQPEDTTALSEVHPDRDSIENAMDVLELPEKVISVTKWEEEAVEVPHTTRQIKAEDVEALDPQTSADLLGNTNEVFVQKSQLGGGSPMLRGFAANSVLIVVDGVRMNNAIYRSGNLQNVISIDPNSMEQVEVILGPGTVIYGSDAMGGVMHFHSKSPRITGKPALEVQGGLMTRYATANRERTGHLELELSYDKVANIVSFTGSRFGDLRVGTYYGDVEDYGKRPDYVRVTPDGDQLVSNDDPFLLKGSGYDLYGIVNKFIYQPGEGWDFKYFTHFSNTSRIPRYDRLIRRDDAGGLAYAEWYYGPQFWWLHGVELNGKLEALGVDRFKVSGSYQKYRESRHSRRFSRDALGSQTENVDVYIAGLDLSKKAPGGTELFWGAEGHYNAVASEGESKELVTGDVIPAAARYPDGGSDYTTYGAYLSIKHPLTETAGLSGGLRYTHVFLESRFQDKNFYDFPFDEIKWNRGALNGGFGINFNPAKALHLRANLGSGFRAPNVDDVAKVFDSGDSIVVVPNDHLRPERAYSAEVGGDYIMRGDDTWLKRLKIGGTLFSTYLDDAMVRRDFTFNGQDSILYNGVMSRVRARVNAGHAVIWGGAWELAYEREPLLFKTALTYTYGVDDRDNPLRHIPPVFGQTHVIGRHGDHEVDLYLNYNAEKASEDIDVNEKTDKPQLYVPDHNGDLHTPAWWTLNFRYTWSLKQYLQVSGGVENVFDLHYRPYSSGISAPGRNWRMSLRSFF